MTNPITPPLELVQQWTREYGRMDPRPNIEPFIATRAAQWGADMELEACCAWLPKMPPWSANDLRKHRRPEPPSLKEQALEQLDEISTCFRVTHMGDIVCDKIRAALKALPE